MKNSKIKNQKIERDIVKIHIQKSTDFYLFLSNYIQIDLTSEYQIGGNKFVKAKKKKKKKKMKPISGLI